MVHAKSLHRLHEHGIKVADRIKIADQLIFRWADYPGLSRSVRVRVLTGKRERQKRERTIEGVT